MKTKKTSHEKKLGNTGIDKERKRTKSSDAYGDKMTICANTGCTLRKKAKCSGFEGCPGFQAR
jgi:hypothetical protein